MPVTSPDGIYYIDNNSPASRTAESAAQAESIQKALTERRAIRSFKWADQVEQDAQLDMEVGDEGFRTDTGIPYRYDGSQWQSAYPGLNLLKPSSVEGGSLGPRGSVTFNAASNIHINGVFSPLFDNYRIVLDLPTVSPAGNFALRMRVGGSDAESSLYDTQRLASSSTTTTSVSGTATSWAAIGVGNRVRHSMTLDLLGPGLAQHTSGRASVLSTNNGANMGIQEWGMWYRGNTVFDGFSVLQSGGVTLTGSIRVYGYAQ